MAAESIRELVAQSRARQGLPEHVESEAALGRVAAVIIASTAPSRDEREGGGRRAA